MQTAIDACRSGAIGYKKASSAYYIPVATIRDRVKKRNKQITECQKGFGGFSRVFTEDQEQQLCEYIVHMQGLLHGLAREDVRSLAYQLANMNNLPNPFDEGVKMAGLDWYYNFMEISQNLSLRQPEATSAARASAFNRTNVNAFFALFETLQQTYNFGPGQIYNADETGITTAQENHRAL